MNLANADAGTWVLWLSLLLDGMSEIFSASSEGAALPLTDLQAWTWEKAPAAMLSLS